MNKDNTKKYNINLTLEEIKMIRRALETETDKCIGVDSKKTKEFFNLLDRFDNVVGQIYSGTI